MVCAEVDRLGPVGAHERIADRTDDARFIDGAAVDGRGRIDRTVRRDGVDHRAREAGAKFRVQLVEIEAGGLPVFVDAERDVEARLMAEPGDVRANLGGAEILIVAVEVDALGVFARAANEARGVEQRAQEPYGPGVEEAFFKQAQQRERRSGFVAVNAGGKIEARARAGSALGQREQGRAGDFAETFHAEIRGAGGGLELRDERGRVDHGCGFDSGHAMVLAQRFLESQAASFHVRHITSPRPLRPESHRILPHRERPHGAVQLALCASHGRDFHLADRGHRPCAQQRGVSPADLRQPELARDGLG